MATKRPTAPRSKRRLPSKKLVVIDVAVPQATLESWKVAAKTKRRSLNDFVRSAVAKQVRLVPKRRRIAPKLKRAALKRKRKRISSAFACTACGMKFRGQGARWEAHRLKHQMAAVVQPVRDFVVSSSTGKARRRSIRPTRSPRGPVVSFDRGKARGCPFCPLVLPDAVYRDHVRSHEHEERDSRDRRPTATFVQGGRIDSNPRRH